MYDLSIIIVTFNSSKDIIPCLDSIYLTKENLNLEVIVVDNCSKDNTVDLVENKYSFVKVIKNEFNVGFPHANNQAISLVQGQTILLLNPDTIVLENALINLFAFFKNISNPIIAGMNVRNPDNSFQSCIRRLPTLKYIFFAIFGIDKKLFQNEFFNGFKYTNKEPVTITIVESVSGAALAFNRRAIKILEGLDTQLFYYEDTDLCKRAFINNIPVYFLPNAWIKHFGGQSEISNKARVIFQVPYSRVGYFKKHHSTLVYLIVRILTVIELTIRLVYRLLQYFLTGDFCNNERIRGYCYGLGFAVFGLKPYFLKSKSQKQNC
jgi:GT2 family glycosyltransferase